MVTNVIIQLRKKTSIRILGPKKKEYWDQRAMELT